MPNHEEPPPRNKLVGGNILRLRHKRGFTQKQLADPDFSISYISAIERGRIRPSLKALDILAGRLGVTPAELLIEYPEEIKPISAQGPTGQTDQLPSLLTLIRQRGSAFPIPLAFIWATVSLDEHDPQLAQELLALPPTGTESTEQRLLRFFLQGQVALAAGRPADAQATLEPVFQQDEFSNHTELLARCRFLLARAYEMQQQFLHAADTFTACAQAIENGTVGDPLFALNVYFALAEHHRRLGQHDAAAPYYQQAMKQLDFILKPEALAETSARLSQEHLRIAHAALGDWYAARSRILFQFAQARHRIAQAASNLGLTLQTLGDLQAAEQQLRQTIDLCSRLGARRQAILARIALADLLPKRQQLPEAKRLALEAEALSRPAGQDQIGDEMLFGRVLVTLGNVYKALNRLDEADGYFQQAISLLKRLNAREPLSQAYYSYSELLHLKKLDAESYEMVNLAYLLSQPRHDEPPTDIC